MPRTDMAEQRSLRPAQEAEVRLQEAHKDKERLEQERNAAIDAQSAHVYQAEQDLARLDREHESRLRGQELRVRECVLFDIGPIIENIMST